MDPDFRRPDVSGDLRVQMSREVPEARCLGVFVNPDVRKPLLALFVGEDWFSGGEGFVGAPYECGVWRFF